MTETHNYPSPPAGHDYAKIEADVASSAMADKTIEGINSNGAGIDVFFTGVLVAGDITILDGIVAASADAWDALPESPGETGTIQLSTWRGLGSAGNLFGAFNYDTLGKVTEAHWANSGTNRDGKLVAQGVVPDDFGGWFEDCGQIDAYRDGDVDSHDMRIEYDGTPDSVVNDFAIKATANQTHERKTFTPGDDPTAGQDIRIEVRSTCDGGEYAEHSSFALKYRRLT